MGSKKSFDLPAQKDIEQKETLLELTETLQKELKRREDHFKNIPTPIDFAKLQNDVDHHSRFIHGAYLSLITLVITVFVTLIGGYLHFDNKVSNVEEHLGNEFKEVNSTYRQLETKINEEIKSINHRVDAIIIPQNRLSNK